MDTLPPILLGLIGSLAAGTLTAVGAVPVLFGHIPSRATRDLSLGFAAGVIGRLSDYGKPDDKHWQAVREA